VDIRPKGFLLLLLSSWLPRQRRSTCRPRPTTVQKEAVVASRCVPFALRSRNFRCSNILVFLVLLSICVSLNQSYTQYCTTSIYGVCTCQKCRIIRLSQLVLLTMANLTFLAATFSRSCCCRTKKSEEITSKYFLPALLVCSILDRVVGGSEPVFPKLWVGSRFGFGHLICKRACELYLLLYNSQGHWQSFVGPQRLTDAVRRAGIPTPRT